MRYIMKQKIFSFSDKFYIRDEFNNDIYYVEGQIISFGKKLSFQDTSGNELVFIKQKLLSFMPTYEIYINDSLYAVIKKEPFTLFNSKFDIEVFDSSSIRIEGNFLSHEYSFWKNDLQIARVSREWFTWSDVYGIDINDNENNPFILACAVIIDMICHQNNK